MTIKQDKASTFVERQIESAVQDVAGERAVHMLRGVRRIAEKQGGETTIENYQLLVKRALIALGVTIAVVQVATSAVGLVLSRRNEEKRIERVVRRVLSEERR